jgi:hypothetical protein
MTFWRLQKQEIEPLRQRGNCYSIPGFVSSGLVHRFIQVIQLPPVRSCPDLFRASTKTGEAAAEAVDGRVKPGHERMGGSSV